jgi:transcription elongation factor GreB
VIRYRPPQKKSAPYITPTGYNLLNDELRRLWKKDRPKIVEQVSEAAALGDRSENADYIYGKRRLGEIDRRIRYLSQRLDELIVVDKIPEDTNRIFFGAHIELTRKDDTRVKYRIVGPDEFDRASQYISCDSPVAKDLIGKQLGDHANIRINNTNSKFEISAIYYDGK